MAADNATYAVVKTGGKQYKVAVGDIVKVEKLETEPGSSVSLPVALVVAADRYVAEDAVELVVAIETEFSLQFSEGAVGPSAFRTVHSVVELVLDPPEGITRVEPSDSPIEEAEAG